MRPSRSYRRKRGKRERYRTGAERVRKIVELRDQGFSTEVIAQSTDLSTELVEAVLNTAERLQEQDDA